MADEPTNKNGIIVRADFGQGVDQSTDYWRSPPGSMAAVTNGRLDRVGNIRKRYGYQLVSAAGSSPGVPISTWAANGATVVLDVARDDAMDTWLRAGATRRIMDESAYVARSYAPAASDPWRTIGPASDVIGDVRMLDGNLGTVDDTIDLCADDTLGVVFLATVSKNVAGGGNTTITVTQYDRTTTTVLSVATVTVAGQTHLYPKMLIAPGKGSLMVATCYRTSAVGLPGVATVDFRFYNYTANAVTFVGLISPTAVQQAVDYWDTSIYDSAAGQTTSNSIYRPHCPFDLVGLTLGGSADFVLATYTSVAAQINLQRFTLDTATIVPGAVGSYKPAGITSSLKALSICAVTNAAADDTIGLVGVVTTIPATATNGQIITVPFNATTLATRATRELYTHTSLSSLYVGRLTCVQNKEARGTEARFVAFAELLEAAGGNVYSHRMARVGMSATAALAADSLEYFSSATPTTRAFVLDYPTTTSTGALPVRLGLAIGASTADPVSTTGVTDDFTKGANYPPAAGTFVVAGTRTGCLSCIGTPNLTRVPTLVPQAPPNWTTVGGVVSLPHLVSTDSASGFGMGLYALSKRASGDADGGVWATMPIVAGGAVQQVDGERMAEATLADRPKLGAVALTNSGTANSFGPGSYLLYAVAVYRDSRGLVHRSTPSDPYRLTIANTSSTYRVWTVYVSTQQYTNRDDVAIELYVTEPNGTIARLWQTVSNTLNQTGYIAIPFYDSAIASPTGVTVDLPSIENPALYTTGGVLPYVPVPSARFAFTHRNRLVTGGADDARNVYYSTEGVAYRGASFAVGQLFRLEEPGGCTAATTLNDKIVLFSASNCYAVYGQFPDQTGAGDALAGPENLHDQLGCTAPTSMMSIGSRLLWWATDKRVWIMDAQLAVQPVGERIQDATTTAAKCNASIHVKDEREVRWFLATSTNEQVTVVYNYNVDQWSTDTINIGGATQAVLGACVSDQLGVFAINYYGWARELENSWLDGSEWITLTATTNWIEPGGTQDYARMRYCQLLARWKAPHNLTVSVWTDLNDVASPLTVTFANSALLPVSGTVYPEQVKFQIANQKTQAVKIQIADSAPGGITSGEGPELVGLALDLLPLGGARRLPVTRKG
jgi:hypothetical protein